MMTEQLDFTDKEMDTLINFLRAHMTVMDIDGEYTEARDTEKLIYELFDTKNYTEVLKLLKEESYDLDNLRNSGIIK